MKILLLSPPSKFSQNVIRDLVYGCWCKGKRIASAKFPPTSLLSIASVIKKSSRKISLLTPEFKNSRDGIKEQIIEKHPDIIIIPTSTTTFREDAEFLKEIKEKISVTTIVYGSHVTFLPKLSLKESSIDFIVMREPEYVIRDLIDSIERNLNIKKIRGIGFKEKDRVKVNPPYPFIKNLDELPFPDRELVKGIDYFNPLIKETPWTIALSSRGCFGKCIFCTSPQFYGNTFRARSPENVVKEIEEIKKMGYKEIFFRDETFTMNMKRTSKICKLILKKDIKISWICNSRIGTVNKEFMKLMKDAGCHVIKFGVESGVQNILDNIKKGTRIGEIKKTFSDAHDVGIDTHAHVMLGCVGETEKTVNKTIDFVKEIDPTTATFGAFTAYPGTELFKSIKNKVPELGDGTQYDISRLHTIGFYNYVFCDLSDEEIGKAVHNAYRKFYLRPKYVLNNLKNISSFGELKRKFMASLDVALFGLDI